MKTMFIQGGSRWKIDTEGNTYTDANFTDSVWERYRKYSDEFTIVLRDDTTVYDKDLAAVAYNKLSVKGVRDVHLDDLYRPKRNFVSPHMRKRVTDDIALAMRDADRVIIREPGNFYTDTAIRCAAKLGKPYLIEVTSDIRAVLSSHGPFGKVLAPLEAARSKRYIQDAPYVLYVTESYLQEMYPTNGAQIGCSDVCLQALSEQEADAKIKQRGRDKKILHIGTAAGLDVSFKNQDDVIRALAILKANGITSFRYHLIGNGTGERLIRLAKNLGVEDFVIIDGSLPHQKVASWLDSLDLYAQTSFTEGLSRSILEAMGRACPIVCSRVGGNYELVPQKDMYHVGKPANLALILQKMLDPKERERSARNSYETSLKYEQSVLDEKRNAFLAEFFSLVSVGPTLVSR